MKTAEEFVTFQQKMRASGLSLAKFLASEHVSSSTYYYWERKYAVEKHASPIENQTLIPVTISTPVFHKTIPHSSELIVRFPNGIQVQVPTGLESSVIELVTSYPYHHVLPETQ